MRKRLIISVTVINPPTTSPGTTSGSLSALHSRQYIRFIPWRMRHPWISRRRVEQGLVGLTSLDGLLHGVVDLQDDALGAVLAVGSLVLALDDGEGVHDVVHVVAGDAVEVEVGGVQGVGSEPGRFLQATDAIAQGKHQ